MLKTSFAKILIGVTTVLFVAVLFSVAYYLVQDRLDLATSVYFETQPSSALLNNGKDHNTQTVNEGPKAKERTSSSSLTSTSASALVPQSTMSSLGVTTELAVTTSMTTQIQNQAGVAVAAIQRQTKMVTEKYKIPYKEVYEEKNDLPRGVETVGIEGIDGYEEVVYEVVYEGERELSRTIKAHHVIAKLQNRVIYIGTAVPATSPAPTKGSSSSSGSGTATAAPTVAPTQVPTTPHTPSVALNFTASGSNASAFHNLNVLKNHGLIKDTGTQYCYGSFTDNGDGTITVDGVRVSVTTSSNRPLTAFDGLECCLQVGCHTPPINHSTSSGVPAQRGLAAVDFNSEFAPGTVLFIEDYGFAVVADFHGVGAAYPDLIDVCYDAGELRYGGFDFGRQVARVYVVSTPGS